MSWLGQALHPTRGFSLGLLARGVSRVLSVMGRITGQELLEQVAGFVGDLNELFGGFKQRASAVASAFRGPEFGFVLVSSTRSAAIEESLQLARQLAIEGMSLDAFIVNRVQWPAGTCDGADIEAALLAHSVGEGPAERQRLVQKIMRVATEQNSIAAQGAARVRTIETSLAALAVGGHRPPLLRLPEFPANLASIDALKQMAEILALTPDAGGPDNE